MKNIKQTFDLDSNSKQSQKLDVKVFTSDRNSTKFQFEFKKGNDGLVLDDTYKVDVLGIFRNTNRKFLTQALINDGVSEFTFDSNLIDSWDIIDCYVYLKKDDEEMDVSSFSFKVDVSEIDTVVTDLKVYYVESIDTMITDLQGYISDVKEQNESDQAAIIAKLQASAENILSDLSQNVLEKNTYINEENEKLTDLYNHTNEMIELSQKELEDKGKVFQDSLKAISDSIDQEVVERINEIDSYTEQAKDSMNTYESKVLEQKESTIDKISEYEKSTEKLKEMAELNINADSFYIDNLKDNISEQINDKPKELDDTISRVRMKIENRPIELDSTLRNAKLEVSSKISSVDPVVKQANKQIQTYVGNVSNAEIEALNRINATGDQFNTIQEAKEAIEKRPGELDANISQATADIYEKVSSVEESKAQALKDINIHINNFIEIDSEAKVLIQNSVDNIKQLESQESKNIQDETEKVVNERIKAVDKINSQTDLSSDVSTAKANMEKSVYDVSNTAKSEIDKIASELPKIQSQLSTTKEELDNTKNEMINGPYQAWANSADGKTDFSKINIKNIIPDSYDNGVTVKFLTDIYSDTTLGYVPIGVEITQVNATIEVDGSTVDTGLALRCVFLDKDNAFINQTIGSFSANRFKGTLTFTAKKPVNAVAVSFRLARNLELSNFSVLAKRFMVTTNNSSAGIFLPSKKSDRYNAFMKYTGFSNKDSNDYRDYTWVRSDEAQSINYEAWASDKSGTNFSRYYPKPNLVGGNASAFKDWYPTAGAESGKDNVATRVDGGILQQSGISAVGTDALTDYRQWQVSSAKSEGSDLLKVKANTMYTISFESRVVSQSWVGSSSTIDFRANYKDRSTKILGVAKVTLNKEWQVGTATFILTQDDITNVDYFRIVVNHIGQGTVQFRRMKMEENNLASMFIPNSRDTGVKAIDLVPAYRGISNTPSTDYLDYVWDKSEQYRDAELQQIRTAITAMGGTL